MRQSRPGRGQLIGEGTNRASGNGGQGSCFNAFARHVSDHDADLTVLCLKDIVEVSADLLTGRSRDEPGRDPAAVKRRYRSRKQRLLHFVMLSLKLASKTLLPASRITLLIVETDVLQRQRY